MEREQVQEQYWHLLEEGATKEEALSRFDEIVRILRVKCPWDREQTHDSLRKGMIEEAYEVVEAIQNEDPENLREELGDVLLQVVFHSLLGEEEEAFDLTDVINWECEKMIRRHPHVFGHGDANSVDKVLEKWENIKEREHSEASVTDKLIRVPKALPALIRSYKVQAKAAKAGFDWDDVRGAFDKVAEETGELIEASREKSSEDVTEELGDLLFSVVNVARFLDVEPEDALQKATDKFVARFRAMETLAKERGRAFDRMSLDEMDALWEEIKGASLH